jgi:uncharacterized membrane protein (DUF485 family)
MSVPAAPQSEKKNRQWGLLLFTVYFLFYAAYVALNAFCPRWMDQIVGFGLNLAILYGFGLILGAFLLALVYARLCQAPPRNAP